MGIAVTRILQPFVKYIILATESITVPIRKQMIVANRLELYGKIKINGQLIIL